MIFDEFEDYKYKSIRITPQIIVEIIFHLYKNDMTLYERKHIVQEVVDFHRENGGDETESNNPTQVKKALQSISSSYIKNPKVGYWQFMINEETDYNSFYNPKKKNNLTSYTPQSSSNNYTENIKEGWIYFYYYPSYKELSKFKNEVFFPIKIGKSKNEPKFRVNEQSGTALPEKPFVFLEVKTQDCANLERNIHSTLTLKGQKSSVSIGNEWFNTNEEEMLKLINNIKLLGIELEINLKT